MRSFLSNPRFAIILLLGFSSGLPLALTGSTLTFWLAEDNASLKAIGLFALVGLPYALKFLWAPLIDQIRLPVLTSRFGRRRGWGLFIQLLLAGAICALALAQPAAHLELAAALALGIGFLSASQDIVIDALRVEMLRVDDQGTGAATAVMGYRLGMLASGAGALYLARYFSWASAYGVMAALIGIGMIGMLLAPEPIDPVLPKRSFAEWMLSAVLAPLRDLTHHVRWPVIGGFIVFYKLGAVLTLTLTSPLYVSLGFSKLEVANISKLFGLIAALTGGFAGGYIVKRCGIWFGLLLGGVLQTLAQFSFLALSVNGHNNGLLMLAIGSENFTGAMATAALVAYLSSLCRLEYTATQYALLSALSGVSLHLFAAPAGYLAAAWGWPLYYALTPLAALPGLALLSALRRPSHPRILNS